MAISKARMRKHIDMEKVAYARAHINPQLREKLRYIVARSELRPIPMEKAVIEANFKFSEPFVEVPVKRRGEIVSITLRGTTPVELADAQRIRDDLSALRQARADLDEKIKEIVGKCPHIVSIDMRGYTYDERFCYACGEGKGTV